MSDLWSNKDHWDSIGYGAYPVDIQAQTPQDYGFIVAAPTQYAIPFRSLVPKEIDGLLVVGRASGYSSIAAGSARIVPTGMTTGEAAGAAAALAVNKKLSFREMSKNEEQIIELRENLKNQGALVDHFNIDYPYKGEWYDPSIQTLINYGLIFGRYDNDMKVDDAASNHAFINLVKDGIQRSNPDLYIDLEKNINEVYLKIMDQEEGLITRDEASTILEKIILDAESSPNSWSKLIQHGLIDQQLSDRIPEDKELQNKEMYAIGASIINYLKGN